MFNPIDIIIKLNYITKLENYLEKVNSTRNIKELNELYNYVKVLENKIYNSRINIDKKYILSVIHEAELFIKNDYLIPYNPILNLELSLDYINKDNPEEIASYIINEARKELYIESYKYSRKFIPLKEIPTANRCKDMSKSVLKICNDLGIKAYMYKINPAYTNKPKIYNGNGFHYVVFAKIKDKYYLLDCTYSQFFISKYNNLNRLGICNLGNCSPGIYMNMNEERRKVANKVLTDGWIEMTKSNIKNYLDGFTMSYRNGLYYENTNDFSFNTNYKTDDYIKFIKGEDNTINHEGRANLGYQLTPLQNPHIKF